MTETGQDMQSKDGASDEGARLSATHMDAAGKGGRSESIGAIPLDLLPDATIVADVDGRIASVNRQFESLFGHPAARVVGKPIELLMPARFREGHTMQARQYRERPRPRLMGAGVDLIALRADGTEFPVAIALGALDKAPGRMIVASIRDISDRKAVEESLRDSERRYRELVENSPDMVYQLDARLRFSYLSAGILSLQGYDRQELMGRPIHRVLTEASAEVAHRYFSERMALERGGIKTDVRSYELNCIRKDGRIVPVEVRSRPVRDRNGVIIGLVGVARDIADRRRAEEVLRENRAHLALAQRVGRIGSLQIDLATGREFWSEEMYRLVGLDPFVTNLSVPKLLSLTHPDDRERLRDLNQLARKGIESEPIELRVILPDGRVRWLLRTPMMLRDEAGTARTHFVTYQDISERKLLEAALHVQTVELQAVREHLERAQAVGHVGSADVDLATLTQHWSDEYYRLIGLAPQCVPPSSELFRSKVLPEDLNILPPISSFPTRSEPIGPLEFRVRHDSGEVRWMSSEAAVAFDADGKATRATLTMRDITQDKLAEEALRAHAEELRRSRERLLESQKIAHLGSWELDLTSGKLEWSDEVYCIVGVEPSSFPATFEAFLQIVHPEDRDHLDKTYRAAVAGGVAHDLVHRVVRLSDGETRWCHEHCKYERDAHGRPIHLIGTVQDITDRKRAEEERSTLQYQLYQSQKLDALGQLAGGVAHDFNNLLAVILGRLEMAVEELADRPKVRDWVLAAVNAARRGASLTKTMLAFARAQPLEVQDVDASAIVLEMTGMLERLLGGTIAVNVTTAPEQCTVEADPGQLQNALINLVVNARDAMPKGGTLIVETANVRLNASDAARIVGAKPGDHVAISVKDTGSGMSPEVAARAFEPFFTTKDAGNGTGLGLSMVDGFVKQSGGHVVIDSEPGRGTTVSIYLPRKMVLHDSVPAAAKSNVPRRGTETILVVEDDDELRNLIVHQIRALDYRVVTAANAIEGLAALRSHPEIALLISDIALPNGVDGIEAAQSALDARPDLKIVFMTGHTDRAELPMLGKARRIPLLRKPFANQDLAEAIREAFDRC